MAGLQTLCESVQKIVQEKIAKEARAKRGKMQDGKFFDGNNFYPAKQAVDVDISNGSSVWAQLDSKGNAVTVGS